MNGTTNVGVFRALDFIPSGALVFDQSFIIQFWNTTFENWTQENREDVVGQCLLDKFPHLGKRIYRDRFQETLEIGSKAIFSSQMHKYLIPCPLGDGKFRQQECYVYPFSTEDQSFAVMHAEDVTSVVERSSQLRNLSKLKDRFLAATSHDLRSPLNIILGFADILSRDKNLDQEGRDDVTIIRHSGESLLEMVDDLLELSKLQSQKKHSKTQPKMQKCKIAETIHSSVQVNQPLADKKNIHLDLQMTINANALVLANKLDLTKAFTTLISNAVILANPNSKMKIGVSERSQHFFIMLSYNGQVIPDDRISHVFEMYSRVIMDSPTEKNTGLGLSLVKSIIQYHGGQISANNRSNHEGTTFTLTLPVLAESQITQAKHFLVIDPTPSSRQNFSLLLESTLHGLEFCTSQDELEKKLETKRFDLIFLDVDHPQLQQIIEKLNHSKNLPPIVACSSNVNDLNNLSSQLVVASVSALTKPLVKEELLKVIQTLMQ